jgi:RimJ/RimL family protein N-acetyltransferase
VISVRFSDSAKHSIELNAAVGDFVSNIVYGEAGQFSAYASLAVFDNGKLIAGVLYHHFSPRDGVMEMSAGAISKRWLTRPVLRAMFAVPFDLFGCQLAVLRVSEHNKTMLRIAKAYGFAEYVIPRLRGRSEAEHVLTLADETWRSNRFNRGRS